MILVQRNVQTALALIRRIYASKRGRYVVPAASVQLWEITIPALHAEESPVSGHRSKSCGLTARVPATLPVAAMIRRIGELGLMEFALVVLRCSACDCYVTRDSMVRLRDGGFARRPPGRGVINSG